MQQPTGFRYVCDTEGFYQHYTECWLDAFTMIFLFADGIKEVTQPAIYNTPIDALDFSRIELMDPALVPQVRGFALNLRERFIRHYWNQVVREHTELPVALSKRGEGQQAYRMAITGRCIKQPNMSKRAILTLENYRAHFKGGSSKDIIQILHMMIRLYKLDRLKYRLAISVREPTLLPDGRALVDPVHYSGPAPTDVAFWFAIQQQGATGGHVVAFYACGGNQYIYENVRGPMPYPWRSLLDWIEAHPEEEMRLGFMRSDIIPIDCVDVIYDTFPIAYKYIKHPETGAKHMRFAIICMDGRVITGTISQDAEKYLYEIIDMVKFISDIPAVPVEGSLPYTQRYYPRKTLKATATATAPQTTQRPNATGQQGSGRRHRSKRRTRKH